jgi:condensin-2 complex subunit G2
MSQEDEETCADDESRNSSLARKALFRAVEEREDSEASYSCKPLLNLFEPPTRDSLIPGHSAKQHHALMVETIQCFSKNHARRFFSALKSVAEVILSEEAYVPESAFCDEDDDEQDDSADIQPDPKSTEALNFLKYAAVCVEAILEGRKQHAKEKQKYATSSQQQQLHIPAQVYDVAVDLHNILFSLQSCGPDAISAQNTILTMCESWWHANASHRENLIVQCLPLLTLQALDGGKEFVQSHFKRLFQLRDAFFYIDFTNPSSDSLRALLLRVASNPLCLKLPEGKRFLAALFQDPILVSDLHSAIRAQIPDARKTVLLAYGEIYTKAWKDATTSAEEVRDALEHQALQDLMHAVIHVASPTTHKSILIMLEPLHEAKKSTEVATLLYRLYSPILWRSLGASNPLVRVHAMHVLAQVFPLQDPSQSNQMQQSISKATTALEAALTDSDPRVRVAASEATAQIAALFWEALPAADIRMLLNRKCSRTVWIFFAYDFFLNVVCIFLQMLCWNMLPIPALRL